jgi:NAD(P)-dependent dehydrogenase (short-subunit alcohol dehydrogenase family)
MAASIADFRKMLDVNTFGTFVVNAYVADAINAQYPSGKKLPPRVDAERGIIINFASAAASPYARVLCYGPTKSTHSTLFHRRRPAEIFPRASCLL